MKSDVQLLFKQKTMKTFKENTLNVPISSGMPGEYNVSLSVTSNRRCKEQ